MLAHIEQKWDSGIITTAAQPRPLLHHIRIDFPPLDAVIGGIPCGKTTQLLGTATRCNGSREKSAAAPQSFLQENDACL